MADLPDGETEESEKAIEIDVSSLFETQENMLMAIGMFGAAVLVIALVIALICICKCLGRRSPKIRAL